MTLNLAPLPGFQPGTRPSFSRRTITGDLREKTRNHTRDKHRAISGENRERMAQRSAARLGVTVDEYWQRRLSAKWFQLLQHQTDRILANERIYEHAERRAKRDDCSDEEKRAEVSADMLRRYHADPSNWSTARKRRRIFERDNWRCRACGKKVTDKVGACHPRRAVAGHILAKATGGRWTNENMATLCYPCNVKDGVNQLPIQIKLVT